MKDFVFYSHREICGVASQSVVLIHRKTIRIFIQHYVCKHRIAGKVSSAVSGVLFFTWYYENCANELIWHIIFSKVLSAPLPSVRSLIRHVTVFPSRCITAIFTVDFSYSPLRFRITNPLLFRHSAIVIKNVTHLHKSKLLRMSIFYLHRNVSISFTHSLTHSLFHSSFTHCRLSCVFAYFR